ncbi:DNA phosphorothioation-dependent restriction protein DptH [Clostridium sp. N3C]|uniref:DNA phosphorothioation-dependent restriction protein DptH n=1 Tax=Clostridium sp. N3C TaxID=1776758 RepID=UPI00092DF788|nr:DNA phosphorothioation-dependent restriction protein DptH [Clostridium sp. N3C]SCN26411.1 DNA phosphorothioation-dependent restriction protein DptH [Clostridium sp. N3C]
MSDQFYSYLSNKIINFFHNNPLTAGTKYNIQFENESQVKALYDELKNSILTEKYQYKDESGEVKYESYLLNFPGAKLIVAATIDNVQPDFLTRLRNMVGIAEDHKDKAILLIHNTNLDSIIGGTESFSKEGMPFHINSIEKDIESKLATSNFSEVDKEIIKFDLKNKKEALATDSITIFEFKDLLEIINGTCIERNQYSNFGLFYDSELTNYTGSQLKDRISKNFYYYNIVNEIHNYGNPEVQLDKYFDEKGIEKLKGENWKETDYKDIVKFIDAKKQLKPLEYKSSNVEWDKEEGATKAKARIRNVIVFNENGQESVELEFAFDDYLKSEFLKTDGLVDASVSGKRIKAVIHNSESNINFYKITYKNDKSIKFEFKIAMLKCNEKYLESIKTRYSIVMKGNNKYIAINSNESDIIFNENGKGSSKYEIDYNNETIEFNEDEKLIVKISDNFEYENDSDIVKFNLQIKECKIPMAIIGTSEKISPIEGIKVWKLKREAKSNFKLIGDNKLQLGTKEFFARDDFRKNIQLEKEIIESEGMYFVEYSDGLEAISLEVDSELKQAYSNIIKYYKVSNCLPSLTYLNEDLIVLYENFIAKYIQSLESIKEGIYLTKQEKNLFKIGVLKREIEDREIILTSLHPLNIVYQLHLHKTIQNEAMDDEIIKRFTSTYLLPYILDDNGKLFIPVEQYHTPEWKYYVDEALPRYKSSRDFVAKLVQEKIEEFVGHFKYMFNMGNKAPIRINLINTGDSKEILQGIFKYYIKQLKVENTNALLPIELFIYSNKNITNAFEEVAFSDDIKSLKETYDLDLDVQNMSEGDVLDLYRDKVRFYTKKQEEGIEYAHITFIEMSNDAKIVTSTMDDIPSGVILNGLISGVPSTFLGDSYRTGFGIKHTNTNSDLMKIAMYLNALIAASEGEPYNRKHCKAISIPNDSKAELDSIYNASHWVTFIDPKVDLNFFKNDPDAKDLLIIHYSDQYTTAGGYDAITVTRKSGPYQKVIEEYLSQKGINDIHDYSPKIINMFNAVNGDWLLRLLSSRTQSHFPKEKISILSAIKLALAIYKMDNIIWVPISLEEVLRVSGGAGLKQNDGLFSAKNLGFDKGVTCDDLLLVGIESKDERIYVHYYPIEVKIGENQSSYIQKGIEQVRSTKGKFRKIFEDAVLTGEFGSVNNTQKVYRNFLMQLVVTSAEKLKLYNVCDEVNWERVIDSDLRRKLLNEEYEISNFFDSSLGEGAVISFKRGSSSKTISFEDSVMVIEMSEEDGVNFINKTVTEIRNLINDLVKDIQVKEVTYEDKYTEIITSKYNNEDVEKNEQESSNDYVSYKVIEQDKVEDLTLDQIKKVDITINDNVTETIKSRDMRILFGVNQKSNKEIYWCPNDTNKLMHTNTGIIGTMGTGKTQFTKSMVTQIYRESINNVDGKKVGILIFDYKGDYNKSKQDFIEATDAKVFELYHLPFNPLSIVKTANSKPMLPMHTANGLKETLSKAFGLGPKQEIVLRDLIMLAYESKGIIKNNPETWDIPAPTLKDVYDIYMEREDIKKDDSLYAAFSNLIDFEIFEPDSSKTKGLFELIDGVTVIDLSGYDPGIQNLVVAITLDLFYSQMQAYGHSKIEENLRQLNKIILVDEADNFLSKNFTSLKKILKEGREFGVGTILSTQLLSHFSTGENEYANYILTWVIHNVADLSYKDVKYIFNTQNKQEDEALFSKIKSLNKHYSLVKMPDSNRAIHMRDLAFWELISKNNTTYEYIK